MKVAILITGRMRYYEHALEYLKSIIDKSVNDITVFASTWDDETHKLSNVDIPIINKPIDTEILTELYDLAESFRLTGREIDEDNIKNRLPGFIAHLIACTLHRDELREYDVIVKWRWDLVMPQLYQFENACDRAYLNHNLKGFVVNLLSLDRGQPYIQELAFFADSESMLDTFTPYEQKFIDICKFCKEEEMSKGVNFAIGNHTAFSKLMQMNERNVWYYQFNTSLLRENILEYDKNVMLSEDQLVKLQRDFEQEANLKRKMI